MVKTKCSFSVTCDVMLGSGRARRRHAHKKHGPLPTICSLCREPFITSNALVQHQKMYDHTRDRTPKTPLPSKKKAKSTSLGSSGMTRDKSGINSLSSANIDTFIATNIQPDSSFLNTCGVAVDRLVNFLQHQAPEHERPRRVIKGGSLGKGTAVKGKSDADIVVMLKDYTDVDKMVQNIRTILQDIEKTIKADARFTFKGMTHRAVQVKVRTSTGSMVEADILPAVDVTELKSLDTVFSDMGQNYRNREYYSPCLAPLQSKLFAGIPTKLKSLIRLVKYWKKEKLVKEDDEYTKWPSSYVTELIVLNAWEQAGEPTSFDMARGLHAVLTSVVNHDSFRVVFDPKRRFYDRQFLPAQMPATYIIDPCNPYNNVYTKGGWDWYAYAKRAQDWLQQPLFYAVRNTKHDWQ